MTESRRRFGLSLVGLARRWRRCLDDRLAQVGLTDATWAPLVHLQQQDQGINQKDLAALVGLDQSSLVRLLDLLEERHLIERCTDPDDRRAKLVHLTDAGRRAVAEIRREIERIEDEMLAGLGDREVEAMLAGFAQIDACLRQMRGQG